MRKRSAIILTGLVCLAVGSGIGTVIGAAWVGIIVNTFILNSNAGWLSTHIGYLTMMRGGRVAKTIADIERTLDNNIVQLSWAGLNASHELDPKKLPPLHLQALQLASQYARSGYADAFSPSSLRILDQVGLPQRTPSSLVVGAQAAEFEVLTVNGRTVKLSDFRGKWILLDFWAASCVGCILETPHLKAVWNAYGEDPRFAMIGLSLDKDMEAPKQYADAKQLGWIQGFLGDWSKTRIPAQYGVQGIPSIFLIDPEGKIIAKGLRGERIMQAVGEKLGEPRAAGSLATQPVPGTPLTTMEDLIRKGLPPILRLRKLDIEATASQSLPEVVADLGNVISIHWCQTTKDMAIMRNEISAYWCELSRYIRVLRLAEEGRKNPSLVCSLLTAAVQDCLQDWEGAAQASELDRQKYRRGERGSPGASYEDDHYERFRKYEDPIIELERLTTGSKVH